MVLPSASGAPGLFQINAAPVPPQGQPVAPAVSQSDLKQVFMIILCFL